MLSKAEAAPAEARHMSPAQLLPLQQLLRPLQKGHKRLGQLLCHKRLGQPPAVSDGVAVRLAAGPTETEAAAPTVCQRERRLGSGKW